MKSSLSKALACAMTVVALTGASKVVAQPAASPLDVHGLDHLTVHGVRARAMGGTTTANATDATALFSNPAALSRLSSFEVRASGLFGSTMRRQTQEWVPERPVPGLGLLFEGLTGSIKTPTDTAGNPLGPWETVQRQYDDLRPNWDRNSSGASPLSLAAAMPLNVAGMEFVAAVGLSQVINLDEYYQNNNSMSPYLGQLRPYQQLFSDRTDTVHVKWYQYIRQREGAVYGVTPGIAFSVLPGLTIGGSLSVLTGSSDDKEQRVERGHVNVSINNGGPDNFMLDTVYYVQSKVGTSDYEGASATFGLHFRQERYAVGLTLRSPTEVTRTWNRTVTSLDTTRKWFPVRIDSLTARTVNESGKDVVEFPLSYALGVVLTPTRQWTIAFDYEMRNLAKAELTSSSNASPSQPWVSSSAVLRLGAEYRIDDAVALRAGYCDDVQAFSPDGSGIIGEPARGGIYTLGAGFAVADVLVEFAYEYSRLRYQDIYQSNVNYQTRERHQVLVELGYRF